MPNWDHEDLKSMGSKRERPEGTPPALSSRKELEALKAFIRELYQDAISTDDARDFTIGVQDSLRALITSWGEKVLTPEEYMEQQRVAQERADDEREFERLAKKLGKQVV